MEMTCPNTAAKTLMAKLATHMTTCGEKINSLMAQIATSTALIADFTAKASVMSPEETAQIESLANLFGSNSGLIESIKAVVIEFKKTAFTPMIHEAEGTAARAGEMKAVYDSKCEAFPQLTQEVEAFIKEMSDAYHAAHAKVGALNSATEEAVAAFMAVETPVVIETPVVTEAPVVVEMPVTDTPVETAPEVVVEPATEATTEGLVSDTPASTDATVEA